MLYVHDTFDPGLAVSQASHMDSDCSIDNCVTFINGPVLMALELKYKKKSSKFSIQWAKILYQNYVKYIEILSEFSKRQSYIIYRFRLA